MLFGIKFSVLIGYWANGFGFHWQVGFLRSGCCYQSGLGLVQFGFGSWAMTCNSRRVVLEQKPTRQKDHSVRRAVTLDNFLPTREIVKKTRRGLCQRLSLKVDGLEGVVSSRIQVWSNSNLCREMPIVMTKQISWKCQ